MKKILLIVITALIAISTGLSLEPMKVAYYTTNTGAQTVHVEIKDYSSGSTLFVGENYNLTPNGSGIVIVNIEDFPTGANGDLSGIDASTINTSITVDVYVGSSLFSQQRLDQLIKMQSSTTVFDNSGNLNPPTTNSSLGQDDNRWEDAYIGSNTLHVGPNNGMTGGTEMTLSYDELDNKGDISIDGTTSIELKTTGIAIPNLSGVGNRNIGVDADGNVVINNTPSVTAGNGLTLTTNTLDVGGSATIIANADDVEVNSSGTANQVLLSSGTVGTATTYGALPLGNSASVTGTLPVARGGTGAATLTTGNFLQGNGTGAVTATKAVPTGDVVGTTDAQTLTNKTINADDNNITNIFPDQSTNNGNFLTTDGSNVSWGSIPAGVFTINGANNKVYRNDTDDDFIFGDDDLNWTSGTESKMYFDNSKGAFRVGAISNSNWDTDSLGDYSFATGLNTKAIGNYSTAMGSYTTSSGSFSTAMGKQTTASGYVSTAMGEITTASASRSTAMGRNTTASGYASTAMGEITTASGDHSTAIGISTTASGDNSIAMGNQTTAKSLGETVVGYWNTDYTPDTDGATQWNATDRLFVIGNGAYGAPSDAMIVLKNGDTEINGNVTIEDDLTVSSLSGAGDRSIGVDANGKLIELAGGGGGGGSTTTYTEITSNTTLNTETQVVFITGNYTVTLPNAPSTGQFLYFYSESTTATLDPQTKVFRDNGSDYGSSQFSDFTAGTNLTLFYNGTKWLPIGRR